MDKDDRRHQQVDQDAADAASVLEDMDSWGGAESTVPPDSHALTHRPDTQEGTTEVMTGDLHTTGTVPGATAGVVGEIGTRTDSHEPPHTPNTTDAQQQTHEQTVTHDTKHDKGDVPPLPPSAPVGDADPHVPARGRVNVLEVTNRLRKQGDWNEELKLELFKSARHIKDKDARQQWVYSELDRMYPPVSAPDHEITTYDNNSDTYRKLGDNTESGKSDDGTIQGLGDLPSDWPDLPANAALASEVGWVQANRLRVTSERPSGATVVRLDQALSPAPSWSALGWLETSIRSYAKFVDVAAKVTGGGDEEGAVMKRERKSVDEVRSLLDEMMESVDVCPSCGRAFTGT